MPGVPSNATFNYRGISGLVIGIQVETPVAVLADMTPVDAPARQTVSIPTGEIRGGAITVDFIDFPADPQALVGTAGPLAFTSTAYSVGRQVVLESATVTARVGELVSGQLKFRMTDFYG